MVIPLDHLVVLTVFQVLGQLEVLSSLRVHLWSFTLQDEGKNLNFNYSLFLPFLFIQMFAGMMDGQVDGWLNKWRDG